MPPTTATRNVCRARTTGFTDGASLLQPIASAAITQAKVLIATSRMIAHRHRSPDLGPWLPGVVSGPRLSRPRMARVVPMSRTVPADAEDHEGTRDRRNAVRVAPPLLLHPA